ncbi:type II toxin-antitoxin system Phd/YefM family antitoxin [Micromonospora sp. DT62]|uniref:type II toxin-antitoxin system Phd/YefM family antitoxin n=2 Tax=Micromonospora sp. DT62 TaxID=3416521 RepID=UPI003CF4030A
MVAPPAHPSAGHRPLRGAACAVILACTAGPVDSPPGRQGRDTDPSEVQFSVLTPEVVMRTVNFTQLRQNLAAELDRVINDAEEVVVTRSGHEPVVIVPLAEYEAMKETEYLLRNPANAAALRRSIAELEQGDAAERDLIDPATVRDVA